MTCNTYGRRSSRSSPGVLDWDAFISLHKELRTVNDQPADRWLEQVIALAEQVVDVTERFRRDARALVLILGIYAPAALWLREVADDYDELVWLTRRRVEAGSTTPEIKQA